MVITLLGVIGGGGGGVAIYTNKELSCKLLETKSMTVEYIFECVSVELSIKNYSSVIINCVRIKVRNIL